MRTPARADAVPRDEQGVGHRRRRPRCGCAMDRSSGCRSGRAGKHIYHYASDGTLERQVTNGPWEVRTLHGVDEARRLGRTSPGPSAVRSAATCIGSAWTGRCLERLSQDRGQPPGGVQPGVRLLCRRLERRQHAAAGAAASRATAARSASSTANRVDALDRFILPQARIPAGQGARRLRHGSHDDQAAELRSVAALSGVQFVYGGPAQPACAQRLVERESVPAVAGAAGHRRVGVRQSDGERQGHRVDVAGLPELRRARAARHRRRPELAEEPAVSSTARGSAFTAGATAAS